MSMSYSWSVHQQTWKVKDISQLIKVNYSKDRKGGGGVATRRQLEQEHGVEIS
jgi:hypothetical protein